MLIIKKRAQLAWKVTAPIFQSWLASRLLVLLIPVVLLFIPIAAHEMASDTGDFWVDRLITVWAHWDGFKYLSIAGQGYTAPDLAAFYPLYPFLIRLITTILFGGQVNFITLSLSGVFLSLLFSLVGVVWLRKLVLLDYSPEIAQRTILYILLFPTAFFFQAVYTESLFLALTVGAFLFARRKRWGLALLLTALAVLTKNQGLFVALALLAEYFKQRDWKFNKIDRQILYFGLPLTAELGWLALNWLAYGSPLAFLAVNQTYWDRYPAWPWETLGTAFSQVFASFNGLNSDTHTLSQAVLELPSLLLFLGLTGVLAHRVYKHKIPLAYLIFTVGCGLQALIAPRIGAPLYSFPRFLLVLFPIFIMLASLTIPRPVIHRVYLIISLILLLMATCIFCLGYWIA